MRALGLAALLLGAPALAQFEDEQVIEEEARPPSEEEMRRAMRRKLQTDPAAIQALAERLSRSKLAARISSETDAAAKQAAIAQWIQGNPDQAAWLGYGLAKDDEERNNKFEQLVARNSKLVLNPKAEKGLFGRLNKSGRDSKLLKKDAEEISDEEQREIIKNLFEGEGSQSNKIVTQNEFLDPEKAKADGTAGPGAKLDTGFYDRLGAGNLRGYSPQLAAMQSALNQRRVPGAPKLIETGKLDYETLSYPGYGMRWDLARLDKRLRYERNWALAKAAGLEGKYGEQELVSAELEAQLKAKAGAAKLSPRFERRLRALERAAAAIRDFDQAGLAAKEPDAITRQLLFALGGKQKEAARWITIASLEEELTRLDAEESFLSPELVAMIERAPVDVGSRDAYKKRGAELLSRLKTLKANDEQAVRLLEADDWLAKMGPVERALGENVGLRRNLSRAVQDYGMTAYRFAPFGAAKPRWRELTDRAFKALLPSSSYARRLKRADSERALLKDVFLKIAMGNLDAAHTILASSAP